MALISIPKGNYEVRTSQSAEFASFDGFLRVSDSKNSTVTSRPSEAGYDYTDAVHNQARVIDISIVISETSQSVFDSRSYVNFANSLPFVEAQTYVQQQLTIIEEFQEKRFKVTFVTKYKEYEDYLIQNISYDETNNQGLTINFNLVELRDGTVDTTDNTTVGPYS